MRAACLPSAVAALELRVPLPVKALYAVGVVKDSAEKIDHSLPPALPVAEGVTPEHGKYVANLCIGCHGEGLSGGKIPADRRTGRRVQSHSRPGNRADRLRQRRQVQSDVSQRQTARWERGRR